MGSRAEAKKPTAEELAKRKRVITGGTTKGGSKNQYVGTEVLMNPDGNGFTFGPVATDPSSQFKWNEKNGDYRSHGGGILEVAEVAAPTPEESSGGGGGAEQQASGQGLLAEYNPEYVRYNQGGLLGQGLTTEQIVGGPLHPGQEEWIHQVNPNHQVAQNLGTYVLPDFRIV